MLPGLRTFGSGAYQPPGDKQGLLAKLLGSERMEALIMDIRSFRASNSYGEDVECRCPESFAGLGDGIDAHWGGLMNDRNLRDGRSEQEVALLQFVLVARRLRRALMSEVDGMKRINRN